MTPTSGHLPTLIWAAREIQRHPGRSALLAVCLASLVFLMGTILLFDQALESTWTRLMEQAPDLVVRCVDGGAWAPLPLEGTVARAEAVPGVVEAVPRLWGVVAGPDGPLTVTASPAVVADGLAKGARPPEAGQAVVGRMAMSGLTGNRLTLGDRRNLTVTVIGTFPDETGLATHDLVWLAEADVRTLLGLSDEQASDLAIRLSRREEEKAIQADLAAAFSWSARITDRSTSALNQRTRIARTGGLALTAGIPALLALLLVVTAVAAGNSGLRMYWGLLRAMGWTGADLVRLQVFKALITAVPAIALGLAAAYGMVFWPPAAGVTAFWITGGALLPALTLDSGGAPLIVLEIAAAVALPYLAAVFLNCLRDVAGVPHALIQADPWS